MTVIFKNGFFVLAGCLVSTICLSTAFKVSQTSPTSSLRAVPSAGVSSEDLSELGEEAALKNERFQTALVQLRKNINLSTSELLEAPSE